MTSCRTGRPSYRAAKMWQIIHRPNRPRGLFKHHVQSGNACRCPQSRRQADLLSLATPQQKGYGFQQVLATPQTAVLHAVNVAFFCPTRFCSYGGWVCPQGWPHVCLRVANIPYQRRSKRCQSLKQEQPAMNPPLDRIASVVFFSRCLLPSAVEVQP